MESYTGDVEKFFRHLNGNGPKRIAEIGRADATAFFSELVRLGFKPSTINKAVNSLSCFEHFLKETRVVVPGTKLINLFQISLLGSVLGLAWRHSQNLLS